MGASPYPTFCIRTAASRASETSVDWMAVGSATNLGHPVHTTKPLSTSPIHTILFSFFGKEEYLPVLVALWKQWITPPFRPLIDSKPLFSMIFPSIHTYLRTCGQHFWFPHHRWKKRERNLLHNTKTFNDSIIGRLSHCYQNEQCTTPSITFLAYFPTTHPFALQGVRQTERCG